MQLTQHFLSKLQLLLNAFHQQHQLEILAMVAELRVFQFRVLIQVA